MNSTASFTQNSVPLRAHALAPFEPDANRHYTLEMVARLAQVSRHRVVVYCRYGLVTPAADPSEQGWSFDGAAVRTVRQLEQFRQLCGVNVVGAQLMLHMMHEIEDLRRELRFLRGM
jgi:hypothetical protein